MIATVPTDAASAATSATSTVVPSRVKLAVNAPSGLDWSTAAYPAAASSAAKKAPRSAGVPGALNATLRPALPAAGSA